MCVEGRTIVATIRRALDSERRNTNGAELQSLMALVGKVNAVLYNCEQYAISEVLLTDLFACELMFFNQHQLAERLNSVAVTLKQCGRFAQARRFYQHAIAEFQQFHGTETNDDIAKCYINIGALCRDLGELSDAESSYWAALEIRSELYQAKRPPRTREHVALSACYNHLGVLLKDECRYKESKRYLVQALAIREAVDRNSKSVADSCLNIASVDERLGSIFVSTRLCLIRYSASPIS
jgi:tetratricopeptide (TPR) repeat protein